MYNILTNIIKTYYIDTSQGALDGCTIQARVKTCNPIYITDSYTDSVGVSFGCFVACVWDVADQGVSTPTHVKYETVIYDAEIIIDPDTITLQYDCGVINIFLIKAFCGMV